MLPLLLLVVDGAELHPDARVPGYRLDEELELGLRLLEPAETDEQVAQPFDEARVVRVRLDRGLVEVDGLVGLVAALVDEPEGRPRGVVVRIDLGRALERGDRLVPLLGLDGDPSEQIVRLDEIRLHVDQPLEDRARLVVALLLDVLLSEREIRVLRRGGERDGLLELALGVGRTPLAPVQVGQGQTGGHAGGIERDALLGGLDRARHVLGAAEPLGELDPQCRRVRVILDGQAQLGDRVLEPALSRLHLGLGKVPVGAGRPAARRTGASPPRPGSDPRRGRARGLGRAPRSRSRRGPAGGPRRRARACMGRWTTWGDSCVFSPGRRNSGVPPTRDQVLGDEAPHRSGEHGVGDRGDDGVDRVLLLGAEGIGGRRPVVRDRLSRGGQGSKRAAHRRDGGSVTGS